MIRKVFFVFLVFVGILEAKEFLSILDNIHLTKEEKTKIKIVLEDYHQERKVYYKNINRTEETMLLELFQGEVVDFEKYKAIMGEINKEYVEAQIKFYQLLYQKLGKERMKELAQEMLR